MDYHKKTMQIVTKLDYNARQVSQVLDISTKGAEHKMKESGSNKFLQKDFEKFRTFIQDLQKTITNEHSRNI